MGWVCSAPECRHQYSTSSVTKRGGMGAVALLRRARGVLPVVAAACPRESRGGHDVVLAPDLRNRYLGMWQVPRYNRIIDQCRWPYVQHKSWAGSLPVKGARGD